MSHWIRSKFYISLLNVVEVLSSCRRFFLLVAGLVLVKHEIFFAHNSTMTQVLMNILHAAGIDATA